MVASSSTSQADGLVTDTCSFYWYRDDADKKLYMLVMLNIFDKISMTEKYDLKVRAKTEAGDGG